MAFHGDLDGIDLEDIIALIGARSGVLSLGPIQGKTLNLHVAAGLVASFSIEQNIEGKDRIFKLARWFSRHRCSFSFEQKPINATQYDQLKNLPERPPNFAKPGAPDPIGAMINTIEAASDAETVTGSVPDSVSRPGDQQ